MRMSYDRFSLIAKSLKYSLVVKIRKKPNVSLYSLYQGRDLNRTVQTQNTDSHSFCSTRDKNVYMGKQKSCLASDDPAEKYSDNIIQPSNMKMEIAFQ